MDRKCTFPLVCTCISIFQKMNDKIFFEVKSQKKYAKDIRKKKKVLQNFSLEKPDLYDEGKI